MCNGNNSGCTECKGGRWDLIQCPLAYVDDEIFELIRFAYLWIEHGLAPIKGGVLDQSASFVQACEFISQERNYWKRALEDG